MGVQRRTLFQDRLIHREPRRMQSVHASSSCVSDAQKDKGGRDFLGDEGKVLAGHCGLGVTIDAVAAVDGRCNGRDKLGCRLVVHHRRVVGVFRLHPIHVADAPHGLGLIFDHLLHTATDKVHAGVRRRADRASYVRKVRDDVEGTDGPLFLGPHPGHADDCFGEGRNVPAHDALERHDGSRRGHHRIFRQMGHGRVATCASERCREHQGARHDCALFGVYSASWK
mmetsp:Transcript_4621/g.13129  ORF Transcript_4621/g.13129 Transcript_4621/m.13129 type:complete len:226 (-) Transcript_4621:674-1351(-)